MLEADNDLEISLATTEEFGSVGEYAVTVYVNGSARAYVPPTGGAGFAVTVQVADLNLSSPDKYVTLRADSSDGVFHALTNPIWLQYTKAGDANADGRNTLFDFASFLECMAGPGIIPDATCDIMDFDRDGDVDHFDQAGFQNAFGAD